MAVKGLTAPTSTRDTAGTGDSPGFGARNISAQPLTLRVTHITVKPIRVQKNSLQCETGPPGSGRSSVRRWETLCLMHYWVPFNR